MNNTITTQDLEFDNLNVDIESHFEAKPEQLALFLSTDFGAELVIDVALDI